MEKRILLLVIVLSGALMTSDNVVAQTGMDSWFCCEHKPCLHFTNKADFDYHNCHVHGIGCSSPTPTPKVGVGTPLGCAVGGALLGGLVGSTVTNKNGKNQVGMGAAAGAVTGVVIGVVFGPKKHMGDFVMHRRQSKFLSRLRLEIPGNGVSLILKL